jgi:transcriptional regulator with XRE-family HTH domain
MSINEKIHQIRLDKGMSQAELAFKSGFSLADIVKLETTGIIVNAYTLLQILKAFGITSTEFHKMYSV